MNAILFALFFIFIVVTSADDMEKYRTLREQCTRTPSNSECIKLKSKFLELIQKCQKIKTREQMIICQQVKDKLCAVFPSNCIHTTTTRKRTISKSKSTTTTKVTPTSQTMTNEEFVKVPVNPEELRVRGEYCIRHGKEKKCQQLLNNLKTTYSSCNKKKSSTTPEQIDCHSFQTHLCKAFPKFPPCIKKTSTLLLFH